MTEKKRLLILLVGIGIISLALRCFRLLQVPDGFSLNEIKTLSLLPLPLHHFAPYFRFASALISTAAVLAFTAAAYRQTGKLVVALCIGLAFALEPWSFIFGRYVNWSAAALLYLGIVFCFSRGKPLRFLLFAAPLLVFVLGKPWSMLSDWGKLSEVTQLFDAVTLFFAGDPLSTYLRIPMTGFLMVIDIPFFIVGLYSLATEKNLRKMTGPLLAATAIALLYFFLNPQLVPAERSGLLLACMTVIIGAGYSVVLETGKKNKLVPLLFILALLANLFFYQELFHNHFDRRNSTEWGYAEMSLVRYLDGHKSIKTVYITTNKEYLNTYLAFFLPRIKRIPLTENMIPKTCAEGYNNTCIVKQDELPLLGLDKDKVETKFLNKGGLPEFFML